MFSHTPRLWRAWRPPPTPPRPRATRRGWRRCGTRVWTGGRSWTVCGPPWPSPPPTTSWSDTSGPGSWPQGGVTRDITINIRNNMDLGRRLTCGSPCWPTTCSRQCSTGGCSPGPGGSGGTTTTGAASPSTILTGDYYTIFYQFILYILYINSPGLKVYSQQSLVLCNIHQGIKVHKLYKVQSANWVTAAWPTDTVETAHSVHRGDKS